MTPELWWSLFGCKSATRLGGTTGVTTCIEETKPPISALATDDREAIFEPKNVLSLECVQHHGVPAAACTALARDPMHTWWLRNSHL